MPRKSQKSTKTGLDKPKAETTVIKGTITTEQREILQRFIGVIGSNEQDVIGKIITLWLYNEGYLTKKKVSRSKNEK
jgi:hypothetical protein